jgi:hypothetical protein
MRLLAWIVRRLDRRPSPIGRLPHPERLGLHIAIATERAFTVNPFPFAR